MIEKILCKTCYHSVVRHEASYCKNYNKFMNRHECRKYDHDECKFYTGKNRFVEDNKNVSSKSTKANHNPSNKINKGLEIRNKKLKKKAQKRAEIKLGQENLCRFITIRYEAIEKIDGKYQRTGNQVVDGLQIKNKVYLNNGHYKMLNSKAIKILNIYTAVPEWANEYLLSLYDKQMKILGGKSYE